MWIRGNFIIQALFSMVQGVIDLHFSMSFGVRFGQVSKALFSIVGTAKLVPFYFRGSFKDHKMMNSCDFTNRKYSNSGPPSFQIFPIPYN